MTTTHDDKARERYPTNEELVAAIRGEMGLDASPLDEAFRRECLTGMSDPSEWNETTLLGMRFARKFFEQGWNARAALPPASTGQELNVEALKAKFKQIANARVAKWERLGNGGMAERAKADYVTGFGILCDALTSLAAPAQQVEAEIRDKALEEAAQACEKRSEREAYGHAKAACMLDAEAIREMKSAAGSNNGESHE